MHFDFEQILQVAGTIWETTIGVPIEPGAIPGRDRATRSIGACVQITGAWNGAILLDCSAEVARLAASVMFSTPIIDVQVNDMQDALAELVNMVGGNLKALLPETCYLSLPSVVEGGDYSARVPGSRLLGSVNFTCQGQNVAITVLEKAVQSVAA